MPEHTIDEIRMMVGNGVELLIRRAVPEGTPEAKTMDVLAAFRQHYMQHSEDATLPYPGIMELLHKLRADGKIIAVVSNKFDAATKKLCERYFPNMIDTAVGENEAEGIRKKPAPDTVLSVISQFSLNKNECVYIGDSDVDILTAKNAGIPCISVLWGFRDRAFLEQHGGNIFATTPEDIYNLF